MRFWLVIVLVAIFVGTMAIAQVSAPKLRRGEWVCFVANAKEECHTYGWHKRKSVALKAALDLCDKTCGAGCKEDYCEVLK